jgi:arylsulfatase A-like enzyme
MPGKNVIYLVADSLRADHLGCYGADDILTTEIDQLAENGVLFENVVSSAPWTVPSIATHTTGAYPHRLDVFNPEDEISSKTDSVFERFKAAGYSTAVHFDSERRLAQFQSGVDHHGWSYDIEDVLEFISDHSDQRFFMFNLYRGTHLPYVLKYSRDAWYRAKEEVMDRLREGTPEAIEEVKYRYARSVEQFSEWYLKAILDRLEREGILEDTVIVVTSDHGESWERRYDDLAELELYDLHGPLLYDEVLKVPLIISNLGTARGERVEEMIRSVDVLPTLLDALDMPFDTGPSAQIDGKSLAPALNGAPETVEYPEVAFSSTTNYESPSEADLKTIGQFAITSGSWKLLWTPDSEETELYNLEEDPQETTDLSSAEPEKAAELLTRLEAEVEEATASYSDDEEAAIQDRLEDLGYL